VTSWTLGVIVLVDAKDLETQSKEILRGIYHPWRRLFARNLDLIVIAVPATLGIVFSLYALYPQYEFIDKIFDNEILLGITLYLVWIPIEAGFLTTTGTTPAKLLFGIKVHDARGEKLKFVDALKRSSLVFVVGEGFFAISFVILITRLVAYRRLTKTGTTEWDKSAGSIVTHRTWGVVRWTGCVLAYLLVMFIGYILFDLT